MSNNVGFYLDGFGVTTSDMFDAVSSIGNIKTSGYDTVDGFVSGVGSVTNAVGSVGRVVADVNKLSTGQPSFDAAYKKLDQSPLWYTVAQNASQSAAQLAARQLMTAGYSERELHEYNARISDTEAEIIQRNAELANIQQMRVDKITSASRENTANSSGFYTAESPIRALLTHEDVVAKYGRDILIYQAANQAWAKRQAGDVERYKGNMSVYMAAQQADASLLSAYYKALGSAAELNANRSIRDAETSAYGASKQPIEQSWNGKTMGTSRPSSTVIGESDRDYSSAERYVMTGGASYVPNTTVDFSQDQSNWTTKYNGGTPWTDMFTK